MGFIPKEADIRLCLKMLYFQFYPNVFLVECNWSLKWFHSLDESEYRVGFLPKSDVICKAKVSTVLVFWQNIICGFLNSVVINTVVLEKSSNADPIKANVNKFWMWKSICHFAHIGVGGVLQQNVQYPHLPVSKLCLTQWNLFNSQHVLNYSVSLPSVSCNIQFWISNITFLMFFSLPCSWLQFKNIPIFLSPLLFHIFSHELQFQLLL